MSVDFDRYLLETAPLSELAYQYKAYEKQADYVCFAVSNNNYMYNSDVEHHRHVQGAATTTAAAAAAAPKPQTQTPQNQNQKQNKNAWYPQKKASRAASGGLQQRLTTTTQRAAGQDSSSSSIHEDINIYSRSATRARCQWDTTTTTLSSSSSSSSSSSLATGIPLHLSSSSLLAAGAEILGFPGKNDGDKAATRANKKTSDCSSFAPANCCAFSLSTDCRDRFEMTSDAENTGGGGTGGRSPCNLMQRASNNNANNNNNCPPSEHRVQTTSARSVSVDECGNPVVVDRRLPDMDCSSFEGPPHVATTCSQNGVQLTMTSAKEGPVCPQTSSPSPSASSPSSSSSSSAIDFRHRSGLPSINDHLMDSETELNILNALECTTSKQSSPFGSSLFRPVSKRGRDYTAGLHEDAAAAAAANDSKWLASVCSSTCSRKATSGRQLQQGDTPSGGRKATNNLSLSNGLAFQRSKDIFPKDHGPLVRPHSPPLKQKGEQNNTSSSSSSVTRDGAEDGRKRKVVFADEVGETLFTIFVITQEVEDNLNDLLNTISEEDDGNCESGGSDDEDRDRRAGDGDEFARGDNEAPVDFTATKAPSTNNHHVTRRAHHHPQTPNSLAPPTETAHARQQVLFEPAEMDAGTVSRKIDNHCVCLASVDVVNAGRTLRCTVKVKNFSFLKHVFARYTDDNWLSHSDVPASYHQSDDHLLDIFVFSLDAPGLRADSESLSRAFRAAQHRRAQFAIGFQAPEHCRTYWDNNDGKNYRLLWMY